LSLAGHFLFGRTMRLTVATPVPTPGNYRDTTFDVVAINGADDRKNPGNRVRFRARKSHTKEPNTCEVTVTNLAPATRASLEKKGVKVQIEAGYSTAVAVYFVGDVRTCDHKRAGPDWDTVLKCGDGDRAFRFAQVSTSWAAGTTASVILTELADKLGLRVGNVPARISDFSLRFEAGYVAEGATQRAIDRLVTSLGFTWSIQDGELQVLASGQALGAGQIPLVDVEHGLIGSPEAGSPEKKGHAGTISFKSLLLDRRPGQLVHLKSERYDADIRIKKIDHDADIIGPSWYSDITGVIHGG
jgi:hypothetical protein